MTTETNFTPGPWVLEDNPTVNGQQVAAFEKSGDMAGNRCLQVIVRSHNAADANLIAEAPDLYEELENARRTIQALIDDGHSGYVEQRDRIDRLLAKARGES